MEETVFPYSSQKKSIKPVVIIGLFVLIATLIGGYLFLQRSNKTVEMKTVKVEKKEPTPTEKPKIEKSTIKIQVLNGTGVTGQASRVVKILQNAGYTIDNIKSGNTDNSDNSSTTITARANFNEIVNNIKDILKTTFSEITISPSVLDDNSEFDIVVVTGGKTFETVTPTSPASSSEGPTSSPTLSPASSPTSNPAPTSSL